MMSIAQVRSAGSAGNYYTDKDNYYVLSSMGERWAGQGAEQLGLQGSVDKDVFTRLLEGRLPDGADLSRMQDGRNRHRPGYDLTFSAPKSVSMMAMLGGDKRLIEAHNQAVDFAVRQVEALASTRVMTDGQSETVLTGNLVMALFNHDTSRDQEPQLHTHAVVANVTQHNGEWKTLSSDKVGNGLRGFSGEGRVKGSGDAQFVALQGSRNGESLLADNMQDGVRIARDNPDSGVVVRIAGEGRPWNPGTITGGRVWGDIPDNSVQPGAGNGEPVTAEVLAQRQAEEAIRRETERRADEIVRKMAENKPDLPDGKTEQAVRDIAGLERDRSAISEREAALPESVLREPQRVREAVREVARENLLQERLQQMERDMVRDLQKEKTLGGD